MADKITETGPLTGRFLTSQINKDGDINQYLTKQDRLDWANTHKDRLQGANVSLGADGFFADPKVERKFRNTKFSQLFKDDPQLTEHQKLSPAERDRMYVRYARTLQDRETAIRNEQAAIPATNEANKLQYRFEVTNPAAIRSRMEAATITPGVGTVLPKLPEVLTDEEVAQRVEAVPNYQPVRDRYINDFDGTKRENDINTVKKLAPQLSHSYKELANNNLENEIDWERISPEIMNYLEEGNDIAASNVFNHNVNWALSDNQTFGEAALNWGTRFVSNVGLMAVDLFGLVGGAGEALIGDILVPWVSGDKVDWAQAGATLLYDNTLANWSSDAQEYLRNELPIYTSTGVNDVLLDPESSAFMASMVIPGGTITKLGKGVKTLGKTGKELARAQRWNRISGYAKDYEKAGKELEKVLGNPNHVSYRRLQELGREAEYSALKEGKSVSQAQREAKEIQQRALTDIYRRGTIQRNQIRLSSILEGQQEALSTKKESLNEFEQAWDRKVHQLTEAALRGEINTEGWSYNVADAERWQEELFNNADYMQQLTASLQKMASEQGYALSEADAIHYMNEWIKKEAIIRAQLDSYTAKERPEYDKLASDQANLAGTLTFANNYILLRFSESLGGWTTRVPTYKRIAPMAKEHKSFLGSTREALGGITSFGSETANIGSRIGFNEAGQAIRRITPKSVAQTAGRVGGTMGVEMGQELMQELYSSSNIGTSAWNAEAFLTNHFDGRGSDAVNQEYQSQLLAFMRHAGYGRDWEDYWKIIKSTGAQMLFGVPSVSKYGSFSRRTDKFTGKKYLDDNVRRGSYESAPSYWFRKIEAWTPMNSPTAQSISQVLNTNSNVNTFINTYNNLLEESSAYSGYAASSMNYAARAFDAANRGDETDYEHSKFAAQVAEATFMAQLRGKNQQTKTTYYHNLADINTKRAGETDEGFAARRANTLKELREGAMYNSLKNASDEELSTWAESNGKQMLELIDNAAAKSQQLYDQYDGNISWEQIYGTIYDDALVNYTNARIKEIEDPFKQLSANLTDTKLDEKDLTDKNGKPIHILTESEIMRLAPDARQELIEKAEGKQKEIVDSLMTQLETNNLSLGLNRNVKDDFKNSAKEYQINKEATEEIGKIMHNPESFLRNIRKSKERAATRKLFNELSSILEDEALTEDAKKSLLTDTLSSFEDFEISKESLIALSLALNSMQPSKGNLIKDVLNVDRESTISPQNLIDIGIEKVMSTESQTSEEPQSRQARKFKAKVLKTNSVRELRQVYIQELSLNEERNQSKQFDVNEILHSITDTETKKKVAKLDNIERAKNSLQNKIAQSSLSDDLKASLTDQVEDIANNAENTDALYDISNYTLPVDPREYDEISGQLQEIINEAKGLASTTQSASVNPVEVQKGATQAPAPTDLGNRDIDTAPTVNKTPITKLTVNEANAKIEEAQNLLQSQSQGEEAANDAIKAEQLIQEVEQKCPEGYKVVRGGMSVALVQVAPAPLNNTINVESLQPTEDATAPTFVAPENVVTIEAEVPYEDIIPIDTSLEAYPDNDVRSITRIAVGKYSEDGKPYTFAIRDEEVQAGDRVETSYTDKSGKTQTGITGPLEIISIEEFNQRREANPKDYSLSLEELANYDRPKFVSKTTNQEVAKVEQVAPEARNNRTKAQQQRLDNNITPSRNEISAQFLPKEKEGYKATKQGEEYTRLGDEAHRNIDFQLEEQGAFEYRNSGRLQVGDEIQFVVSEEEMPDNKREVVIWEVTKPKAKDIPVDSKFKGMQVLSVLDQTNMTGDRAALIDRIRKAYDEAGRPESFLYDKESFQIGEIVNGVIPFTATTPTEASSSTTIESTNLKKGLTKKNGKYGIDFWNAKTGRMIHFPVVLKQLVRNNNGDIEIISDSRVTGVEDIKHEYASQNNTREVMLVSVTPTGYKAAHSVYVMRRDIEGAVDKYTQAIRDGELGKALVERMKPRLTDNNAKTFFGDFFRFNRGISERVYFDKTHNRLELGYSDRNTGQHTTLLYAKGIGNDRYVITEQDARNVVDDNEGRGFTFDEIAKSYLTALVQNETVGASVQINIDAIKENHSVVDALIEDGFLWAPNSVNARFGMENTGFSAGISQEAQARTEEKIQKEEKPAAEPKTAPVEKAPTVNSTPSTAPKKQVTKVKNDHALRVPRKKLSTTQTIEPTAPTTPVFTETSDAFVVAADNMRDSQINYESLNEEQRQQVQEKGFTKETWEALTQLEKQNVLNC